MSDFYKAWISDVSRSEIKRLTGIRKHLIGPFNRQLMTDRITELQKTVYR